MILIGYALCVARDVTPESIIAPEYADSGDPALLAAHCFEHIDPTLAETARTGDILVINGNVYTGEGAEEAILALQALGIAAVLGVWADDALVQLAATFGLPVLAQAQAVAAILPKHLVRLDLTRGVIEDQTTRTMWHTQPCPVAVLVNVQRNQQFIQMRRVVEDEGFAE